MEIKEKIYISYLLPGSFVSESTHVDVDDLSLPKPEDIPKNAFAFTFHKQKYTVDDDGQILYGSPKQVSGTYYIDGVLKTAEDFNEEHDHILLFNMEANNWNTVVKCRTGNIQPFGIKDHIYLTKQTSDE
jgi:hypothetical protein